MAGVRAFILGRNMFGPVRGEWPDDRWRGWWGNDPPYHTPVFVDGIDLPMLGFRVTERVATEHATHVVLKRD